MGHSCYLDFCILEKVTTNKVRIESDLTWSARVMHKIRRDAMPKAGRSIVQYTANGLYRDHYIHWREATKTDLVVYKNNF